MGMPGPMEIMIIAGMCGLPLIVGLVVLAVLASNKGRSAGPQAGPPCSHCGGWTVPQANYCQWCGKPLGASSA